MITVCLAQTLYDVVVWHPHSQEHKPIVPQDRLGLIPLSHSPSAEHHLLLHSLRPEDVREEERCGYQ